MSDIEDLQYDFEQVIEHNIELQEKVTSLKSHNRDLLAANQGKDAEIKRLTEIISYTDGLRIIVEYKSPSGQRYVMDKEYPQSVIDMNSPQQVVNMVAKHSADIWREINRAIQTKSNNQ